VEMRRGSADSLGAVVFSVILWSIAIANFLSRSGFAHAEFGHPFRVGAGRPEIDLAQLLTESFILAAWGACSVLHCLWKRPRHSCPQPGRAPRMEEITVDGFSLDAHSIMTGILFDRSRAASTDSPSVIAKKKSCSNSGPEARRCTARWLWPDRPALVS